MKYSLLESMAGMYTFIRLDLQTHNSITCTWTHLTDYIIIIYPNIIIRQTDRMTDRRIDRHTDRQIGRHTDGQTVLVHSSLCSSCWSFRAEPALRWDLMWASDTGNMFTWSMFSIRNRIWIPGDREVSTEELRILSLSCNQVHMSPTCAVIPPSPAKPSDWNWTRKFLCLWDQKAEDWFDPEDRVEKQTETCVFFKKHKQRLSL